MTQNLKSDTKLIQIFLELWLVSFTPKSSDYSRKCHHFFFFWKCIFYSITLISLNYSQYCHCYQYINTTNLKLLMHLKIDFHSFFLNSYEPKTTSLYFLSIFNQKKPKILILKILWFIEPLKLTILGG